MLEQILEFKLASAVNGGFMTNVTSWIALDSFRKPCFLLEPRRRVKTPYVEFEKCCSIKFIKSTKLVRLSFQTDSEFNVYYTSRCIMKELEQIILKLLLSVTEVKGLIL